MCTSHKRAQLLRNLQTAINGQASAIRFYTRLRRQAPNAEHREQITIALNDEREHLRLFVKLYKSLTGKKPRIVVTRVSFRTYRQGLTLAFKDELDAAELYRDTILLTRSQRVRDIFFRAMTDEQEHAARFLYLLQLLKK